MLAEIATEELARTLDEVASATLSQARIAEPPVDAFQLAQRLGLTVAWDDRQAGRARLVQFGGQQNRKLAAVLVRHDPRHERLQWAIAHEVGESLAENVFTELTIDSRETPAHAREFIANALASRLLLPKEKFSLDAIVCGWDLRELKRRYQTASHELIARRMLDFSPPVIISVFDQDRLTWRKSNLPGRVPRLVRCEIVCHSAANQSGSDFFDRGPPAVSAWAIHEGDRQREIVRTNLSELVFYDFV